jgi:hypothetical protein
MKLRRTTTNHEGFDEQDGTAWDIAVAGMLRGERNTIKVTRKAFADEGIEGYVGRQRGRRPCRRQTRSRRPNAPVRQRQYPRAHAAFGGTIRPTEVLKPMIMNEAFGTCVMKHPEISPIAWPTSIRCQRWSD